MKPRRKQIWTCSSCGNGNVHTTKKDAEECCVCPQCKRTRPTAGGGRVYCESCSAESRVESARQALESAANNFIHYRNALEKLRGEQ